LTDLNLSNFNPNKFLKTPLLSWKTKLANP
jgi:hypothetical protein